MAAEYGQRPSSFLGLPPESWEAYQLDHATFILGKWVENKLNERDAKSKPIYKLEDLLADPKEEGEASPMFRSLAGMVTKKVAIKPDGTWDD